MLYVHEPTLPHGIFFFYTKIKVGDHEVLDVTEHGIFLLINMRYENQEFDHNLSMYMLHPCYCLDVIIILIGDTLS